MKTKNLFIAIFLAFVMAVTTFIFNEPSFAADKYLDKEMNEFHDALDSGLNENDLIEVMAVPLQTTKDVALSKGTIEDREQMFNSDELLPYIRTKNGTDLSDWRYSETATNITLLEYIGTSTDILIPGNLNGKQVYLGSNQMTKVFPLATTSIVIGSDGNKVMGTETCLNLFNGLSQLNSLTLENFDTSNTKNMSYMFANCPKLIDLDVSHLNTSSATNMSAMFYYSTGLRSLDLSAFDTSKVTEMKMMFQMCSSLQSLKMPNFNTENVTTMSYMFFGCESLQTLDVSSFETLNVTNMSSMFQGCSALQRLDLSKFNTAKVNTMASMFRDTRGLQSLDVSNFDTAQVTNMNYMFSGNTSLQSLDVSSFHTANVTNMGAMFQNCARLKELDVSRFNTNNVIFMRYMFSGCLGLQSLDVTSFRTTKVTDMENMFFGCSGISVFDLSSFDTTSTKVMDNLFSVPGGSVPTIIINNDGNLGNNTPYNKTINGRVFAGPKYDANGGKFEGDVGVVSYFNTFIVPDKAQLKVTKKAVSEKFTPTKERSRFKGWYLDKECTNPYIGDTTGADLSSTDYMNLTLYAGWDTSYTVHYETGFSDIKLKSKENLEWDDGYLLPNEVPKKAGYTFLGWKYGNVWVVDTTRYNELARNHSVEVITLKAQWEVKKYDVLFDTQGGSSVESKIGVNFDESHLIPLNAPQKEGYIFKGWTYQGNEVLDGTHYSQLVKDDSIASITLVANWQLKSLTRPDKPTLPPSELNKPTNPPKPNQPKQPEKPMKPKDEIEKEEITIIIKDIPLSKTKDGIRDALLKSYISVFNSEGNRLDFKITSSNVKQKVGTYEVTIELEDGQTKKVKMKVVDTKEEKPSADDSADCLIHWLMILLLLVYSGTSIALIVKKRSAIKKLENNRNEEKNEGGMKNEN